jgi:hypothetical protein
VGRGAEVMDRVWGCPLSTTNGGLGPSTAESLRTPNKKTLPPSECRYLTECLPSCEKW